MKGIVLETDDREAAVLFDNGTVSKIKNKHYKKGQVLNMNNKFKFMAKAGSIAAALAITAATGYAYTAPATYVSLDVNPSIEYKLNAFDRVISVIAVNDDGEKIVKELDVNNDKIQKAILKTIEALEAEGYLTEDEYAGIVIAVSNKDEEKSEELKNDIEEELDKDEEDEEETTLEDEDKEDEEEVNADDETEAEETEETEEIEITVETVGRERVEEARKLNVTPGKLNLVQKLIASTDEFDDINEEQLKELLNLSVKEINKMTQAYKKGLDVEFDFEDDAEEDLDDENVEKADEDELDEEDKDIENVNEEKDEEDDENNDEDEDEKDINDNDEEKNNNKPLKEEKEKSNNGNASGKEKNN